jgi:nicotinate-nucleotide adenylyltransferase
MRIAVLGGSFNPLHIGHLALAEDVCLSLGYDRILFVPVFCPPHKEMNDAAGTADRLEMVSRACEGDNRFEAESCEIDRGGVSYTYDTVCFLQKKYSDRLDGKIGLILGQDLAAEFNKWYRSDRLASETNIILARRTGYPVGTSPSYINHPSGGYTGGSVPDSVLLEFPYSHMVLENPVLPISSTEIRARIAMKKSWRYLVPDPVYRYIIQRKLYGYGK